MRVFVEGVCTIYTFKRSAFRVAMVWTEQVVRFFDKKEEHSVEPETRKKTERER